MSERDGRLQQVLRDGSPVPSVDHERLWNGIRARRSAGSVQESLSHWFWLTVAAIATGGAAWFGVRVFPVTTREPQPVAADSMIEATVREPVMQTSTQSAPTAVIPLLGHRSSLSADLDHLTVRRTELMAGIANPRIAGREREELQQALQDAERQIASTRQALQIVDEQLAGLRSGADQAFVVREATSNSVVPAPETIVIGGGEPLALWVAGTGAIVVLAVMVTLVWVRRMTRAAFRELAELRSQAGNQHAVVSEAIDAIALEIERIGESQRFLAKSVSTPHVN